VFPPVLICRRFLLTLLTLTGLTTVLPAQNLVTDGDFEAPNLSAWTIVSGGDSASPALTNLTAHSSSQSLSFFETGSFDTLSQTISTVAGQSYSLSFWLATNTDFTDPGELGASEEFQVLWNGDTVYDSTTLEISPFTLLSIEPLTADGSTSTLTFRVRNDPDSYYLDDVSLTPLDIEAVPEPSTWIIGAAALAWLARGFFVRQQPVRAGA
jgi:hypothetical protein